MSSFSWSGTQVAMPNSSVARDCWCALGFFMRRFGDTQVASLALNLETSRLFGKS